METFTMSRKELPRAALTKPALAGRRTNRQPTNAVQLTVRQIQRLKRRFEAGGAGTSSPWPCRGFSSIRSRPETWLLDSALRSGEPRVRLGQRGTVEVRVA